MKTGMFKKFFTTITTPFVKVATSIFLSILPKKNYLAYMRKHDTAGVFHDISDEVSEYAAYILIKAFNISSKIEGEFLNISFKQNVILNKNQKENNKDKKDSYIIQKLNTEEIDKNNKEIQKLNNKNILHKDSMEDDDSDFHQTKLDKDKFFSIYLNDSLADKNITFSFTLEISEKIEDINSKKNNVMTFNYTVSYKSR